VAKPLQELMMLSGKTDLYFVDYVAWNMT